VEMEDNILDLSNGAAGALTVVFAPAVAEIRGTVKDDKGPVAGAGVVLRNPSISVGSTNGVFSTMTATDGSFRFEKVATGKYLLLAADEGDTNLMSDTYEDYEDVMETVEIRGAEKMVRDLKRHPRR
jgi:hypothetical protein